MKKLFGIFSLSVLLFSTFASAFTYASDGEVEELAKEILQNELNELGGNLSSESDMQDDISLGNNYTISDNDGYVVRFNLNGGYWTEDGTTTVKDITYDEGNQGILTNWRTPSKADTCSEGEGINKKCMFDGWYLEEEGITRWTGYVSENMTVYAKWLPFEDKEIELNDGTKIMIMDRNIGATTGNKEDSGSYGYHFQWGNNYGFKFKGENDEILPNGELTTDSVTDNTIVNNISTYYYSILRTSKWSDYHNNLRGGAQSTNSDELKQGPCPKGYHVPDYQEWQTVLKKMDSDRGLQISNILNLPFPGYAYNSNYLSSEGTAAGYLAANPNGKNMNSELYLYKNGGSELSLGAEPYYKASVRCFKDFPIKNINFHTNSGTEISTTYQTARNWTFEDQDLPIPTKENMDFQGWYTTEDFKEDSRVLTTYIYSTGNTSSIDLYAKWACSYGYESEDNGETCVPYSIKFESNGGNFGNGNKYKISSEINVIENNVIKYSHTSNVDDMGNQNGSYGSNLDTIKVITITGANELNISIKYGTYYDYNDYVTIWKGKHSDFLPSKDYSKSITGKLGGGNHNNAENTKTYIINGESATFGFRSKYVYNYDGYDYYGYYATISGTEKIPYVTYPEHSFDNIPEPTRENSIFKGWYFDNDTFQHEFNESDVITGESMYVYAKWECESGTILSEDGQSCNPNIGILNSNDGKGNETVIERYVTNNSFINNGHEFIGWNTQSDGLGAEYISGDVINESGLVLYAQWKALEEKVEETTTENVVYTNNTTVTVGNEATEEVLSGSSTLKLVTEEVKEQEVTAEEDKTTVKESEIKVTSDKKVEYEGGLEVYLEKTENVGMANESTGKVEGTIKFSAPIAVKIPISSEAEYVKVQVKHEGEEFGFKGLTLNPVNECNNGEAVNDKYNGEDVEVKENNGERYATIYTCSASTFVAYTESVKPADPKPSAGGGRVIKQESNATEQEHNSADLEKDSTTIQTEADNKSTTRLNETVEQKIKKVEGKALTRGEVAVMTNILLEVFPQLIEGNKGLDDLTKACTSYTDEKDFTKDEKKAITRLCKLSIMGIHAEDKTALEEFMVSKESTNNEFNVVVNRAIENYNKKDLATVKEALKKLEGDNEGVVFGTVYDVFMGIKSIFN